MAEISRLNTRPSAANIIQIGRSALQLEAAAISNYASQLGSEFARAVELLAGAERAIIVTGIGKSGHVGRKIAATLSSLDRRAIFLHPSEASHGDLGVIREGDVMLALSNSGESAELGDVLAYAQSLNVPMIAITSNAESTLAKHARVVLAYGKVKEACTNGLAPTTSTTLALAIGDALAVAVMSVIGVTKERFGILHPGGKLGAALMRVGELMHMGEALPIVRPDLHMKEVVIEMTGKALGVAIVQDYDGHLLGLITDGDMRRHVDVLWHSRAGDLISMRPVTVTPDTLVSQAINIMTERKITCLVITGEQGRVVGVATMHDCLRAQGRIQL